MKSADFLTQYAVEARYPGPVEDITFEEYQKRLRLLRALFFGRKLLLKSQIKDKLEQKKSPFIVTGDFLVHRSYQVFLSEIHNYPASLNLSTTFCRSSSLG